MNLKEIQDRLSRVSAELYAIRHELPYITDARTPKIAEQCGNARAFLKQAWELNEKALEELSK